MKLPDLLLPTALLASQAAGIGSFAKLGHYKEPYAPNKCHFPASALPANKMYVAVNTEIWDAGRACGAVIGIKCSSGDNVRNKNACKDKKATYHAVIIDWCQHCKTEMVASETLYQAMSKRPNAVLDIVYF
jgi:hypothetical protein